MGTTFTRAGAKQAHVIEGISAQLTQEAQTSELKNKQEREETELKLQQENEIRVRVANLSVAPTRPAAAASSSSSVSSLSIEAVNTAFQSFFSSRFTSRASRTCFSFIVS